MFTPMLMNHCTPTTHRFPLSDQGGYGRSRATAWRPRRMPAAPATKRARLPRSPPQIPALRRSRGEKVGIASGKIGSFSRLPPNRRPTIRAARRDQRVAKAGSRGRTDRPGVHEAKNPLHRYGEDRISRRSPAAIITSKPATTCRFMPPRNRIPVAIAVITRKRRNRARSKSQPTTSITANIGRSPA